MNSIERLYAEEIPGLVISPNGEISEALPQKPLVLAGSFNPFHEGHRRMLAAAERVAGGPACYEISIHNVDKPVLPRPEFEKRAAQFTSGVGSLIVTAAPRFTEKSSILPGATFVIGFDTYIRLMNSKYYPDHIAGSASAVANSLDLIQENGCHFVVAGRVDDHRQFRGLSDVKIEVPRRFQGMFIELRESQFRSDISSTELRNNAK